MKVTIADVAKLAGVSGTAVSRVLNNYPDIKDETRQKVLDAIAKLNYRPNALARGLAKNRATTVGVIIPHTGYISDPYFPELLRGLGDVLTTRQYDMLLATPRTEKDLTRAYVSFSAERKVDGLVIIDPDLHDRHRFLLDRHLVQLEQRKFPFVVIGGHWRDGIYSVNSDYMNGICAGLEHLVALGHQSIGLISGPGGCGSSATQREAYRRVLSAHGLAVREELIVEGDYLQTGGYRGMRALLDRPGRPTAVMAGNDLMALGAIRAVFEAGLRVPEDVAMVGINDVPIAEYTWPPLTTVRQLIHEMGSQAARMILAVIDGQTPDPPQVFLPTSLVVRASSGGRRAQF